ncbi:MULTISPECIES: restriction endonuclease subunit S [unclassified Acinetobacter]|uniref:restriction endonuclease subunit S n=1 Tax=unclassified Acinetobacter TaxID=196816 RepID=UPI002D1F5454|nr:MULTISPECIES: restriction endonuclease subunit S [unclassified Acinetobacter]MEB3794067.1 restriction endonuclease subunit S [Acinetobacter sp. IK24]MEB3813177.1 restriction endonuclease subunit S [Acinetobacter sp. IK22]MEB3833290.1 restriction endonuclease subunit S [Acinetobacter sp. IK23]MEB3838445.1 restriction endonuclease subunit S [Acinetobacter sp. IK25]
MFDQFPKVKLSEICSINIGGTPAREVAKFWAESHDGVAWVSIADMKQKYISKTKEYISKTGALSSNVKLIPAGSLLMSFKLTVGKVAINTVDLYCNEAIAFFKPLNDSVSLEWLLHVLPLVTANTVTDTAVKGATLNKEKINNLDIPLPEIAVQRKIVKVLDTLDLEIEQTKGVIGKLENSKAGLLKDLLTRGVDSHGKLRPSYEDAPDLYQETELGFIPKEWGIVKLEDIADVSRGKFTHRPRNDPAFFNGAYPFIQTGDVSRAKGGIVETYSQTLSYKGTKVSQEFPKGTIAVTIAANIADTAILGRAMYFPDSVVGVVPFDMSVSRFIELCIRSNKKSLDAKAPQSAQKNINLQDLRPLLIVNPPKEEQLNIINIYEALENRLNNDSHSLNKLLMQKVGLLKDLLQN